MKSKILLFFLAFILVTSLVVTGSSAHAAKVKPIVLKATGNMSLKTSVQISFLEFAKRVNEQAGGKVKIDVLGGPEVTPPAEQAEAVRAGVIDLAHISMARIEPYFPEASIFHLSRITPWEERENGFYDWMNKLTQENVGCYYLGRTLVNAPFTLFTNTKVKTPYNLSGQRIATTTMYVPFAKALDINPVAIEVADTYSAVERGIVEGHFLPVGISRIFGMAQVEKYYITHPFYGASNLVLLVNMDTWNKIPKDMQGLMIEINKEVEHWAFDFHGKEYVDECQKLEDAGMQPITFSPADAKWFIDLAYKSNWEEKKKLMSPESYTRLKELLEGEAY